MRLESVSMLVVRRLQSHLIQSKWNVKGVMWNDFCSRFKKRGLAEQIYQMLIEEGQHNLKFKLGEIISNTPDEVRDIIKKHRNELGT